MLVIELSDAEIGAALRPILNKTKERAVVAGIVERLRLATDPEEQAERNRCGDRMAQLDLEICEMSVATLEQIGLWHAAQIIEQALNQTDA
jgi:hypothetical protein